MSSFVNMMADDIWSEADIVRRTEAMIRSEFSIEVETILNRKVLGISIGSYTPTEADLAEIARYDEVARHAQAAGVAARADMTLLNRVFPLEEAQRRLDRTALAAAWERLQQPKVHPVKDEETGEILNAAEVAADESERQTAQGIVSPYLIEQQSEEGETEQVPDPAALERDAEERAAAQALIDAADEDVRALFELRRNGGVLAAPVN